MRQLRTMTAMAVMAAGLAVPVGLVAEEAWHTISYVSSADQTDQKAMFFAPTNAPDPVPLVVVLHTWYGDYRQTFHAELVQWCISNRWACLHPDFRGPNVRAEAMGSELVVQDVADAVAHAQKIAKIDGKAVYLVGTSGGGFASLLMAGRHPELWAGVSAWVPISDLKAWQQYCTQKKTGYAANIVKACGGVPGASAGVDEEYRRRSAVTWLEHARNVNVQIQVGIHDECVPVNQSLWAFNRLAEEKDRLPDEQIAFFAEKMAVPPALKSDVSDANYGGKRVLFRRTSGHVTLTVFNGGHEYVPGAVMAWLQAERSRGKPVDK